MSRALLLSGGIDSVCIASWLKPEFAITIDYGQRAAQAEIAAATAVAGELNINHRVISLDISNLGTGVLAGTKSAPGSPNNAWWPFRNQFLLSIAAMALFEKNVSELIIGLVSTDRIYLDGTPNFIKRASELISQQEGRISVSAPAINISSAELVKMSGISVSTLAWAHSCDVFNRPCGLCRSCQKYYETMRAIEAPGYY